MAEYHSTRIYQTPADDARLKRLVKLTGKTQSEIVRQALQMLENSLMNGGNRD